MALCLLIAAGVYLLESVERSLFERAWLEALVLAILIGTALWPDLIVAAILATLGLTGGWQIMRQARGELRQVSSPHLHPAE